jgi:transglutaminase-like putative cysteine protease
MPGEASTDVAALSSTVEIHFLAPTSTIDFETESFKDWMDKHSLRRQQTESDLNFAWRVFSFIRRSYSYKYRSEQDRHVSVLCKTGATDCRKLSFLFVAVLRANYIPARCLRRTML